VAAAFESYVGLTARGRDPVREFPTAMARFAVLHVQTGRHVGGQVNRSDVLSPEAQRRHGFRVTSLHAARRKSGEDPRAAAPGQGRADVFAEQLRDNARTPVPDQVAFRLDFRAFLSGLTRRDCTLVRFLSLGHSAQATAGRFKLTSGRVSQIRKQWRRAWLAFQGEAGPDRAKDEVAVDGGA
jgi:hypothetical protein